jgi:CubicO group peptidase (beta-lactamase class C family)
MLSSGCSGGAAKSNVAAAGDQAPKRAFPEKSELLALIQARVDAKRATGIVLGIREADGSHTIVAYGDAGPGAQPLGPKSVFEIGSISKVFTGILLADMAGRGEVTLEDAVQTHAHKGVTIPSKGDAPMRLVDLATHMSGLPRLPVNLVPADAANPYAEYSEQSLHNFLSAHTLQREVGSEQEYSNLGTGLLGHLLGAMAGSSWESLTRERILEPLGMAMSGVALSPSMKANLALGHDESGKVVPNWDFASLAGAGALRSNAEDMLRFVDANLGDAPSALREAILTSHKPLAKAGPNMQIGLNWFIKSEHGHSIIWHNGGTGGYRAFVGFDPDRHIGVVVLENSTHGSDDLGFHLLDNESPLAEPTKVRKEITVSRETLAEYVGIYALSPTFHINITMLDGALYSQATKQPMLPIFAESESEFFLRAVDAQLSFVRDDDTSAVTGMVLHQNGAKVKAKRLAGEEATAAIAAIMGTVRKEVPVATAILDEYVGVYELNPSFKVTITRKGDGLQVQATNQPTVSIFAESDSEFFFKAVDAQISFVRDAGGKVTRLVLHQGGMDQPAPKVE